MRRLIALALLAGVVLALPTMASGLGQGDLRGPACADVIGGSGSTGGVVADLAAAPCAAFSYTLVVYSDETMTTKLATLSRDPDAPLGENQIGFNGLPVDDGSVCVVLTTSVRDGKHVFDIAPDASIGCVVVLTSGSPGFQDFS